VTVSAQFLSKHRFDDPEVLGILGERHTISFLSMPSFFQVLRRRKSPCYEMEEL
jgi:hypothetical protein